MKTSIKKPFAQFALVAALGLLLADPAKAQTFTTLHTFTARAGSNATNSDGAYPYAGLILSGNTLYGTAYYGGTNGRGAVFAVNTDGTGFTNLHNFAAGFGDFYFYTNSDGAYPYAGLILSGNTLYGTADSGGTNGTGTVFALNTNGTGFTLLHIFNAIADPNYTNSDGGYPQAGLILSGNTLYGTAESGGTNGWGTVFAVNTNGTGFTTLHSFAAGASNYTNSDGIFPDTGLILLGKTLYGTTGFGGTNGNGTVFAVNTNGTGFTVLHTFNALAGSNYTNSDGAASYAGLISSGNTLYGTASGGGTSGGGTVFALNTNGTGFTVLHAFTGSGSNPANNDGADPWAGLLLINNSLYGTTQIGGTNGGGTVFAVNTNGTGFTVLHNFTALAGSNFTNNEGAHPLVGLVSSGNTLYGTAYNGGTEGNGTIFSLVLPLPQLTILRSGTNVILTWPTNFTGFTLQSTTNLVAPVWNNVIGQNSVTNPISSTLQFYRLSQ